MSKVKIENLTKYYDKFLAVDDVSLEVTKGEMMGLLGPSGCGKTTLLRLLSGFLEPTQGTILMGEQDVTRLTPDKRPTSLVFQNYALFPHLTVFENVAFGLKLKRMPMKDIRKEVADMLAIVGLEGSEGRSVHQLSGGQKQRIALARALVMKPEVLLLDEPLSNLDAKLRLETRQHIKRIQKKLNITSIFVTHDQEEALSVCDRIAVMNKGKIMQVGTPEEIYTNPSTLFSADFIGKSNILQGEVVGEEGDYSLFKLAGEEILRVENPRGIEGKASLMVRPEYVRLSDEMLCELDVNCMMANIEQVTYLGEVTYYEVRLGTKQKLMVPIFGKKGLHLEDNREIILYWKVSDGLLIDE